MVNRGTWYVAGIALIALAGCAPHPPTGRRRPVDGVGCASVRPANRSRRYMERVPSCRSLPIAGGGNAVGDVTLVITTTALHHDRAAKVLDAEVLRASSSRTVAWSH